MYTSPSGRHYIGRTCNSQKTRARYNGRGYEYCTAFWRAIQKYGWENFEYEVLESGIPYNKIKERENYWIDYYHSSTDENGYNLLMPDEDSDVIVSQETIEKMSKSHIGKEPWNKGKKGVYSEETLKQMSEVKLYKIPGKTKKQKAEKAREKRANSNKHYMTKEEISKKAKERFFGEYDLENPNPGYHVSPVSQFDLDGNYIKTYKSAVQAAEVIGIHSYTIRRCCRGIQKIGGGFQWCDVGNENKIGKVEKRYQKHDGKLCGRPSIPVAQIKDGVIINIFPSIKSAGEAIGIDKHCIGDAANGKQHTAGGFQWRKLIDLENETIDEYYTTISQLAS